MPPPTTKLKPIYITVSLIWHNVELPNFKLQALQNFRKEFSAININHFVSPNYLLGDNADKNRKIIRKLFRTGDKFGLYLAPDKSLLKELSISTIPNKKSQNYWGPSKTGSSEETLLSSFEPHEIEGLTKFGVELLEKAFGQSINIVMTSDWTNSSGTMDAIARAGISYNFSAISPVFLRKRLEGFPIFSVLSQTWNKITPLTTLFKNDSGTNTIFVPQSAGSVDYLTSKELVDIFLYQSNAQKNTPHKAKLFHTSIHLETLDRTLPRLAKALQEIFVICSTKGIHIKPLPESITSASLEIQHFKRVVR